MTIENISVFVTILSVYTLGLISPGPDFALVLRNSVARKAGQAWPTAVGIAAGVAVHLSILSIVFGLGGQLSIHFTRIVTAAGGVYLGFLGLQTLYQELRVTASLGAATRKSIWFGDSSWGFFRQGLWTNLFNPKVAAFFWSLLAGAGFASLGAWSFVLKVLMVILTLLWFWWLGRALRVPKVQRGLQKIRRPISIAMGLLLLVYSAMLLARLRV